MGVWSRKYLAIVVVISLVLTTPGGAVIALSAQEAVQTRHNAGQPGVQAVPVPVGLNLQNPAAPSPLKLTASSLPSVSVPTPISRPAAAAVPAPFVPAASFPAGKVPAASGRVLKPLLEHPEKGANASWGILKVISAALRGDKAAPTESALLKPSAEDLSGDSSSRSWAEKSFRTLKGETAAADGAAAVEVSDPNDDPSARPTQLNPSDASRTESHGTGDSGVPAPAASPASRPAHTRDSGTRGILPAGLLGWVARLLTSGGSAKGLRALLGARKGAEDSSGAEARKALPAPQERKALPAPQERKALPAPQGRKALPAPQERKALPAPQELKALPAPAAVETPAAVEADAAKFIEEDLLGFRRVRGVRHAASPSAGLSADGTARAENGPRAALSALPADADVEAVVSRIAAQFGIAHAVVAEMGQRYRLESREAWLAVYDLLQKANREEFAHLDSKKYGEGAVAEAVSRLLVSMGLRKKVTEASFRTLAKGRTYSAGWTGLVERGGEAAKHVVGALIRFPYHVFDMFVFGFFRRNIAFGFFHDGEDFFAVRDAVDRKKALEEGRRVEERPSAERWLEAAMGRYGRREASFAMKLGAWAPYRVARRWLVDPFLSPLTQFVWKRVTMAALSAAAMGLVAGLIPLPVLAVHLTALPVLGPALIGLQTGLPAAAAHIPFIGSGVSAVLAKALSALVGDLAVGPLLNTLVLSTFMTFPAAARQRFMDGRHGTLQTPRALSADWWKGMIGTLFSGTFWGQNLKSMFGLMTVGAEIEAVMGYAGGIDAALTPAFKAVTGREFGLFHAVAAAVERPEGESPIPFGGAITWGNILLYKLQNALGFNLTDEVYRLSHGLAYGLSGDAVAVAAAGAAGSGHSVLTAALHMVSGSGAPPEGAAGDLQRELAEIRGRIQGLESQLGIQSGRLETLQSQSKPVADAERARYKELLEALSSGRDESYIRSKMAEIRDLADGRPEEAERLEALKRLEQFYDAVLVPPTENPGQGDDLAVRAAGVKALQAVIDGMSGAPAAFRPSQGTGERVDAETQKRIAALVGQVEELRGQAKAELTNREALEKLLSALNTSRNAALRERRNGRDMLEFHKNMARLATVMDLAFSLNEINAAQSAIAQMQALLDRKLEKIETVRRNNAQQQAAADSQRANSEKWRQEIDGKVSGDKTGQNDMLELEEQSNLAVGRIGAMRSEVRALIARTDAEDAGRSPDALTEYRRRQALLPTIQQWSRDGKPGDPDYLSLKRFNDSLVTADDYLRKIDEGVSKLDTVPLEFAGVLIIAVPGVPDVSVSNPGLQQTLQILDQRSTYWKGQRADYQKMLEQIRNRMSTTYSGTETDEFGDLRPYALPRWQAQERESVTRHQGEARTLLAEVDRYSAEINAAVAGANLPMLSGLDLKGLQDAIETYPDKLSALNFPNTDTREVFNAKMAMLAVGRLLPRAGREIVLWTKSDAVVTKIDDVMANTLPATETAIAGIVDIMDAVQRDIDADRAYLQSGSRDAAQNQALVDRKRALVVQELRPRIEAAKAMVRTKLIPFAEDSIKGADPAGDSYAKLFKAQIRLYEATKKVVERTLPWALAANGAADGDQAGGLANIEQAKQKYTRYMTGYDDAKGHHSGVDELITEIAQRKDPNFAGTEDVYGEQQPFSLPRKIAQYSAEQAERAQQMNARGAEMNGILAQIDSLTGGRYALAAQGLPTDVDTTPAGVAKVQRLVDEKRIQGLADKLVSIGNEYKAKGTGADMGLGQANTPPTGTQPSPTVDDNTRIALLCLETAKRLAPSTNDASQTGSAAYAMARFLYSEAVVSSSRKYLDERFPVAEGVLATAKQGLLHAIADLDQDRSYVQSNGSSESPDAVVERKIAIYRELNGLTRDVARVYGLKTDWDKDSYNTLNTVDTYYSSTSELYGSAGEVSSTEREAILKMKEALKKTYDDLEQNRQKLARWMSQLNSADESALKRVAENIRELQDKTRAVLEQNVQYRDVESRLKRSDEVLRFDLHKVDEVQAKLNAELSALRDPGALDPALLARVNGLRRSGGSWYMAPDAQDAAAALVVPKRDFPHFLDQLFASVLQHSPSTRDVSAMRQGLLQNPQGLSSIIPNSQILEFGDADGFYLVYQTSLGVPHGLETSSWATLGNVAQLGGNNISVSGYQFVSPPNGENAPYGDKGVEVQVESLQGSNWVNYLNVDLHRYIQDAPPDLKMESSARQSRLMVFDDFAVLLFGDRLYVGAAGFADFALSGAKEKTSFYGGSLKTSVKFNEVMRLNAEQQQIFAKDPRSFLETVNLDFTGLDPDLNRNFVIDAKGENKHYKRTQIGPSFDLARVLDSEDAFTVDFFYAKQEGTDDYNQQSGGVTILKGFSLRDANGKPWATITNRAGAEFGTKYNSYTDRVSVTLPDYGIAISAEGKLLGDSKTKYFEASKSFGPYSNVNIGYGSRYAGMEDRLTLSMNTSITLAQLWGAVSAGASDALDGSKTLKEFNGKLDGFLEGKEGDPTTAAELKRIYSQDVARRLLQQDIGTLSREITELRKAGAFLDNTRIRGQVGFVTNPTGSAFSDRASGGGFAAGTWTEMTLTRTQRALIENKAQTLYREGLRLQERLLALTRQWQQTVTDVAQAQWELKMARWQSESAPTDALRAEGKAWEAQATARYDAAVIRYDMLSGRAPGEPLPFKELDAEQLDAVLKEIGRTLSSQERLAEIFSGLDQDALKAAVGEEGFNLMDWIPWVDRLTVSVGVQFQDMLAGQILTAGGGVRLPIYDPASKERDGAYLLESQAAAAQMKEIHAEKLQRMFRDAWSGREQAQRAEVLRPEALSSRDELRKALAGQRNGLMPESRLRQAFSQWRWYASGVLDAEAQHALASGWIELEGRLVQDPKGRGAITLDSFQQAFNVAAANSASLEEVGRRREAAAAMASADAHRIQKFWVDVQVGANLTSAGGLGFIPSVGITGIGVLPIPTFELKPEELKELQVKRGEAQSRYYEAFKGKLEADLAVDIYRAVVEFGSARRVRDILQSEVVPAAQTKLEEARANAASDGDPAGRVRAAQGALDASVLRTTEADRIAGQAFSRLNLLLGRLGMEPVQWTMSEEQALSDLKAILAAKDPVAKDRAVLAERVETARAVETIADKGLKSKEHRIEPVSLVVNSLSRLVDALSSEMPGNPDVVAAARIQTLEAERAQEAYAGDLEARRAKVSAELSFARGRLEDLRGKTDAESRIAAAGLEGQARSLEAVLARLGGEAASSARAGTMPLDFSELSRRVVEGRQSAAAAAHEPEVTAFEPETQRVGSTSSMRYFRSRTSVGGDPINKSYVDSWVELRLRSPSTPPEVLLQLARLRTERADRAYSGDVSAARAQAGILLARFETDVRLLRWAERARGNPDMIPSAGLSAEGTAREENGSRAGRFGRDFDEFIRQVRGRIELQAAEIKALVGLPSDASTERLVALAPGDPAGREGDLAAVAGALASQARDQAVRQYTQDLLDGGLAGKLGGDDLASQIRADVIAERMSYKGFTPVIAFGMFRGQSVGGAFLEAPDPRAIQRSLEGVLGDSLRRELQAKGQLQEMSLKLHLLMKGVQDKAVLLERQGELAQAAEGEFRAALARQGRGQGSVEETLSAETALVKAWLDFTAVTADLRSDFTALVTELTALGFPSDGAIVPAVQPLSMPQTPKRSPESRLFEGLSRRMLEPDFAERMAGALRASGLPEGQAVELERLAGLYAEMSEAADVVRHRADIEPAKKLDVLVQADVEGRRIRVERALAGAWVALSPQARGQLLRGISAELKEEGRLAEAGLTANAQTLSAMRSAYADALELPMALRGAFERVEGLRRERESARQALLEDYLAVDAGPEKFVLSDIALDRYLKAESAYDAEVVALFDRPELRGDAALARSFDAVFGLKDSLARRRDLLERGRGMLALDALIMLESARIAGLSWRGAVPSEFREAEAALARLERLRSDWTARKTTGLEPVYAATKTDGAGRRLWTIEGWHTAEEVRKLDAAGGLEKRADGRMFFKGSDIELLAGADASRARRVEAQDGLAQADSRVKVHQTLAASEFALAALAGGAVKGMSYEALSELSASRKARFYTFSTEADPRGLHAALNPLKALWSAPGRTVTVVYEGDRPLARDRFPTLEAFEDHFKRLSVEDPVEAARYSRLEAGPEGVRKMVEAAGEQKLRQSRVGWMGIKLQSYGFAVDKNGEVAALYVTQDDFNEALAALKDAGTALPKAVATLRAAREKEAGAADDAKRARMLADGEQLRYGLVEKEARARAAEKARAKFPDADEARLKLETEKLKVGEGDFKDAQKALAAKVDDANKAESAWHDAERLSETAFDDLRETGRVLAAAGLWGRLGGDYLAALKETGLDDKELAAEAAKLERSGAYSLFVTRDLALQVDGGRTLVGVDARPVFGTRALSERFGQARGALSTVRGEVFAAEMNADQTLAKLFMDGGAVDKAGAGWKLEAMGRDGLLDNQKGVDPGFRLLRYTDPATGLPVMLNRRYLISRVEGSGSALAEKENWGWMPWNWGNIILELPRGVVGSATEILTGRDTRQHGYIGRVYMSKIEGGSTEHHNFFRKTLGALDVLDILPDPVQWHFDPTQFPKAADLDSPLLPGQTVYDKDLQAMVPSAGHSAEGTTRAENGRRVDVHYGRQAVRRGLDYSVEDLLNARRRVLSYFEGGVSETWIETRRGRSSEPGRTWQTSKVTERPGSEQLENALKDPTVALSEPGVDGAVRLDGRPGHLEVDRVQRSVVLVTGSRQYGSMQGGLDKLGERVENDREASARARARFDGESSAAGRDLEAALSDRRKVDARLGPLADEFRRLAWRIGEQEALEAAIRRLESDIAGFRSELDAARRRLAELEDQLAHPGQPTDPSQPQGPGAASHARALWLWALAAFGALAAAAAAYWAWRRRRPLGA
ncbi:MAG: hypothetical protein WC969_06805 [Elusimicrobiota bacterium]